jgi:hypothetical protein
MMPSQRCRLHGGKSPRGLASPNLRTGRYSRDLPVRIATRYEAALSDPELLSVRDDVALLQSAITDLMAEMAAAEAGPDLDAILEAIETISGGWKAWEWSKMEAELARLRELVGARREQRASLREVRELIKEKAQRVQQENRLLADRQQLITVEQYLLGMKALGAAVRRMVDDPDTLRAIDVEFRRLASISSRDRGRT